MAEETWYQRLLGSVRGGRCNIGFWVLNKHFVILFCSRGSKREKMYLWPRLSDSWTWSVFIQCQWKPHGKKKQDYLFVVVGKKLFFYLIFVVLLLIRLKRGKTILSFFVWWTPEARSCLLTIHRCTIRYCRRYRQWKATVLSDGKRPR